MNEKIKVINENQEEVEAEILLYFTLESTGKDYVLYTDNIKSWTINNNQLSELVTSTNMKEKVSLLKYYEYSFSKVDNKYYLTNIAIK